MARTRRLGWLLAAVLVAALLAPAAVAQEADQLCDELLVDVSDGVRLHTWVRRVPPDQPRPVLIEMESYARPDNGCPSHVPGDYYPHLLSQDVFDRFTIVHVSLRGTGSSEGVFDMMGPDTQRDVREVIAWTRTQPWSDGRVVLTGGSGTAFFAHHGLREPGVVMAIIQSSCADMYRCFRRGGSYNTLADVYEGVTVAGYATAFQDRRRIGTDANPTPAEHLAAFTQVSAEAKARSTYDEWWAQRSSLPYLDKGVDVPVVFTSDPYDIVQPWEALEAIPGARLNFGAGHTSDPLMAAAGQRYDKLVGGSIDRLVDAVVFGKGKVPRDRVTLVTTLGTVNSWRAGHALVRQEKSWPLPSTDWTRLHLGAGPSSSAHSLNDGTLTLEAPPADAAGDTAPLVSAPGARADFRTVDWLPGQYGPTDLRDEEVRGLTWTTPVLSQSVEVSGPILLDLWASTVSPDVDWAVRLTSVQPDGASEWVSDGYLRASLRAVDAKRSLRNRDGEIVRAWHTFASEQPLPVGEAVRYRINVLPTSAVFPAGTRIRLDLVPLAAGPADRPAGAGAVTVLRDAEHPSSLLLPVIPRGCDRSVALLDDTPEVGPCAPSYAAATADQRP